VYNQTSQIGIGHVSLIHERYQVVDFTEVTYFQDNGIVSTKPRTISNYEKLTKPFSKLLWALTAIVFFFTTATFLLITTSLDFSPRLWSYGSCAFQVLMGHSKCGH
jgi:hypothetical protein